MWWNVTLHYAVTISFQKYTRFHRLLDSIKVVTTNNEKQNDGIQRKWEIKQEFFINVTTTGGKSEYVTMWHVSWVDGWLKMSHTKSFPSNESHLFARFAWTYPDNQARLTDKWETAINRYAFLAVFWCLTAEEELPFWLSIVNVHSSKRKLKWKITYNGTTWLSLQNRKWVEPCVEVLWLANTVATLAGSRFVTLQETLD